MFSSQKITNLNYLKKLSNGDSQLIVDMIRLFLTEITKEMKLMEKGIIENDFALVKSFTHNMKGTLRYVGLDKIIKTELIEMEKLATAQLDFLRIEMLFLTMKMIFKKAIDELDDWLLFFKTSQNKKIGE